MLPNRYNFQMFAQCPPNSGGMEIGFFDILWAVQLEAALWGLGTALGELPPYLVAKASRLAGFKDDELMELENDKSFLGSGKRYLYNTLQKHAFITVLICASIPNPLFD